MPKLTIINLVIIALLIGAIWYFWKTMQAAKEAAAAANKIDADFQSVKSTAGGFLADVKTWLGR
jgi:hypothetical protein